MIHSFVDIPMGFWFYVKCSFIYFFNLFLVW